MDYTTLTFAELALIMSKPENNLWYMPNGDLVQWRIRQRTIAGAGNGNWHNTDANNPSTAYPDYILNFSGGNTQAAVDTRVAPQGNGDAPAPDKGVAWYATTATSSTNNSNPERGLFTVARAAESLAYNGECYFLVLGSVSRLNQGGFHPSLNPLGTGRIFSATNPENIGFWHTSGRVPINTTADLFDIGPYPNVGIAHKVHASAIGGVSGRDDGKFYDGIAPSGQGGVIDDRLSSWDMGSPIEAAKWDAKVKNGTARGEALLPRCFFDASVQEVTGSGGGKLVKISAVVGSTLYSINKVSVPRAVGHHLYVFNVTRNQGHAVDANGNQFGWLSPVNSDPFGNPSLATWEVGDQIKVLGYSPGASYLVNDIAGMWHYNLSVEGNKDNGFTVQDVIGDPANIIQTPQLAQGWLGHWCPVIPSGSNADFPLVRKSLVGTVLLSIRQTTEALGLLAPRLLIQQKIAETLILMWLSYTFELTKHPHT
ncbi:conserved protein of unknown function [Vibrio maritimus]|uniref:Uncharacterized protein n=1 Tax=Vibrio maritimus TaxID=990268 RepID=A0A090RWH4_9VIBR|nr:conserved protein of unknown function [Vibrio maritimus]